jgi:SAM-dependent methyltransferase
MKIEENNYPQNWIENFQKGYGEEMLYENNSFDLVSSYQTLEHVQDIKKCLSEMCRVVKVGGGIHIMCPDYRSTYEGHYNIAWMPLFPRKLANIYLKLRGRNIAYLKTLNYITKPLILKYLSDIKIEQNLEIEIVDLNKKYFIERLESKKLSFLSNFYFLYLTLMYLKKLFKSEMQTNLFIKINQK